MFEVKSRIHTNRYFANRVSFFDLFRAIQYYDYQGDVDRVPSWYRVERGMSCFTDLTQSMDEILLTMKSNTRNEIRRAEKEGVSFEVVSDLREFVVFYNDFCKSKGFGDYTSEARMRKYRTALLTKAVHDGKVLAMHASLLDNQSHVALLMFSCSHRLESGCDKRMIGWGNRYLHYKELEYLKNAGYTHYDWSGVCTDKNNPAYTIGQFKLSFGGKPVESITLKTPVFSFLECVRRRMSRLYSAWRSS